MKLKDCKVGMKVTTNQNSFGTVYTIKKVGTVKVTVTCPMDGYMKNGVWVEDEVFTYVVDPVYLEPL